MFKTIRKAVKKYMDERVEVIKAKTEILKYIVDEVKFMDKNNKIGLGLGIMGIGASIVISALLEKGDQNV